VTCDEDDCFDGDGDGEAAVAPAPPAVTFTFTDSAAEDDGEGDTDGDEDTGDDDVDGDATDDDVDVGAPSEDDGVEVTTAGDGEGAIINIVSFASENPNDVQGKKKNKNRKEINCGKHTLRWQSVSVKAQDQLWSFCQRSNLGRGEPDVDLVHRRKQKHPKVGYVVRDPRLHHIQVNVGTVLHDRAIRQCNETRRGQPCPSARHNVTVSRGPESGPGLVGVIVSPTDGVIVASCAACCGRIVPVASWVGNIDTAEPQVVNQ
jgi:hypothetical protein